MKNFTKYTFMFLALVFTLACEKDKKNDPQPGTSNTDKISRIWMITGATIDSPLGPVNVFNQPQAACLKDDEYDIRKNGTLIVKQGANKCDASQPDESTGTWEFVDNETKIKFQYGTVTETYPIVELREDLIKLKMTFNGQEVTASFSPKN